MDVREKLVELLAKYFSIGDSYAYNLTRVKEAFAVGTVTLDDFVEFDDKVVADIADRLIAHGVTVQVRGRWVKHNFLGHAQWACSECQTLGSPHWKCCPVCEARMPQPPKGE